MFTELPAGVPTPPMSDAIGMPIITRLGELRLPGGEAHLVEQPQRHGHEHRGARHVGHDRRERAPSRP